MKSHLEQSIRDAADNGFDISEFIGEGDTRESWFRYDCEHDWERFVCRPAFWSALGKARGWGKYRNDDVSHDCDQLGCSSVEHVASDRWQKEWHRFINHLISGGDVESYFESISTNN